MDRKTSAITLLELLITVVIFSIIAVGIANVDLFSRAQVLTAERRAALQHEIYIVMENMSKQVSKAIGNIPIHGAGNIISFTAISGDPAIRAFIDADMDGNRAAGSLDHWIAYRFTGDTGSPATRFQVWYYPNYVNTSSAYEVIGRNIRYNWANLSNNTVVVNLTACHDPSVAMSADNPCVTNTGNIYLPSVSTN